ncbi:hypothetical protein C8C94_2524 [Acidovorax sp. 94]|nr:hypothetical protein C8C94_2524 [Acidovorax sp. 94]
MLMGRLAAISFQVQGLVGMVVVPHLLRMHHHVSDDLLLVVNVDRRQPRQRLPDHGNQQEKGSALAGHGKIVWGTCSAPCSP